MKNHLFITPGDIAQLSAHAVAYSASAYLGPEGNLYSSFEASFPTFALALTTICQHNLDEVDAATDVRALAAVLEFLTHHGWRPPAYGGWDLCRLWERLAAHAPDAVERRRCLIAALGAAEAFDDVRRIHAALEEMEKMA